MVRPRGDARPSRIAWGGRKAVAASASRSIECRGIGSVRLVVSVATGSVTQRIDYDELASSGAIAVRRRAGPSREEWGGRGTPKGDILHPLCLAERGDPAGAAPARGVQGRRAVARNFNTQVDGSGSRDSWDSESYCHERHSSLGTDAPCPSRWAVDIDHERDLVRSGKARARTRAPQTISRASRGARFCDCCSGRSTERVGCTCAAVVLRLRPRHHRYYPDPGRLAHGWGFDRSDCAATVSLGDGALGLCISAQGSAYVARRDGFVYVVASPEALA